MRIALIGCNSLLAGYLIERLLAENTFDILLLGRRMPLNITTGSRCQFKLFDYPTVPLQIADLLDYNALIYCAAAGVQSNDTAATATITSINYELPAELFTSLLEHCYTGKWISFGTYFELGSIHDNRLATEIDVVCGAYQVPNIYCETKRQLSKFVAAKFAAAQLLPFQAWHLILPTIYGADEQPNRLIPYLVHTLREGLMPQLSAGTQIRQYVHGRDVANLVALLLTRDVASGIYNVPGPDILPIKNLVEMVFAYFGQDSSEAIGVVQTRDESMPWLQLDGQKLSEALPEWSPQLPLSVGLSEYI